MSILVIWASPNEDGLTAAAKSKVVEGITAAGGDAEILHLNKHNLKHCIACGDGWGTCRSNGSCVLDDDFAALYEKVIYAEAIVMITPVYWHDLAENLKVLLDRMRRCETAHNHYLQGKICLIIACAGGTGNGAIQCLHNMEETLGHMQMIVVDRLPIIRFNQSYMLTALNGAGKAFVDYLKAD